MKGILNLNDKEFKEAESRYVEIYHASKTDEEVEIRFRQAKELVESLGLGGLWRGYSQAVINCFEVMGDDSWELRAVKA